MKKVTITFIMAAMFSINVNGQVRFPTTDLYDSGMMNMYLDALKNTAETRKNQFYQYVEIAYDYFSQKDYRNFLIYSDKALNTEYYTSELYYMRGLAYELLGLYKQSRKEYEIAYKYGYTQAKERLNLIRNK